MKKNVYRKIFAFLLTLALLVAFAAPSFGASPEPPEETVNGFTIQQLIDAFNSGDTETLHAYLEAFALQDDVITQPPTIQPRWESKPLSLDSVPGRTHSDITSFGFLLYVGDMQQLYGMQNDFGIKLSELTSLRNCSAIPDIESSMANMDHFYDPTNGKNAAGTTTNTARDRFVQYYNQAVAQFPTNRAESIKSLGRALHFIQDVNEPHHAANLIAGLSYHTEFEAYATANMQYAIDTLENSKDQSLYNFARNTTPGELLHNGAATGRLYVWSADHPQWDGWVWAAQETLQHAMRHTAAVFYKFAKDTGMI